MSGLISSRSLAEALGVSNRRSHAIIKQGSYNGHKIEVTLVTGARGRGGQKFLVAVDSLPEEIQDRLKAFQIPIEKLSKSGSDERANRERQIWFQIIKPIVALEKGTSERGKLIDALVGSEIVDQDGVICKISRSALYRKISAYENGGYGALSRQRRSDKGTKICHVSRRWDAAVPFEEAIKAKIAEMLHAEIAGLIKGGSTLKIALHLSQRFLANTTSAFGYKVSQKELLDICRIPRDLITAQMRYRRVADRKKDHKKSEDARPHVRRATRGLAPMEVVVGDVHTIDIQVEVDGKIKTPYFIAFMDMATHRVCGTVVYYTGRAAPNNFDLIEAFLQMTEQWGLPQTLYVDNGSEYRFVDYLADAFKLGIRFDTNVENSPIKRAIPYNAKAKPIENFFKDFEGQFLKHVQGYIGGERHKSKQVAHGKTQLPFNGFEAFSEHVFALLNAYHTLPKSGQLEGKTPNQAYQDHIDTGWRPVEMESHDLRRVFTYEKKVALRKHKFRHNGFWSSDNLARCHDRHVIIRAPKFHHFDHIEVLSIRREHLGWATRDEVYDFMDERGAIKASELNRLHDQSLRELDASVPDKNMFEEIAALGRENPQPKLPMSRATVSVDMAGPENRNVLPFPAQRPKKQDDDINSGMPEAYRKAGFKGDINEWLMLSDAEKQHYEDLINAGR